VDHFVDEHKKKQKNKKIKKNKIIIKRIYILFSFCFYLLILVSHLVFMFSLVMVVVLWPF